MEEMEGEEGRGGLRRAGGGAEGGEGLTSDPFLYFDSEPPLMTPTNEGVIAFMFRGDWILVTSSLLTARTPT